jgi:hypothetical protein
MKTPPPGLTPQQADLGDEDVFFFMRDIAEKRAAENKDDAGAQGLAYAFGAAHDSVLRQEDRNAHLLQKGQFEGLADVER